MFEKAALTAKQLRDKIMRKVIVNAQTGCWEYQGAKSGKLGYGSVYVGNRRFMRCHRVMYIIATGALLRRDQFVCHKCDNPPCCNPDHMFVGSLADNNTDMARKGRYNHQKVTHCPQGHELAGDNVYRPPGTNKRQCRACARIRGRSRYAALSPAQRVVRNARCRSRFHQHKTPKHG